MSPLAAKRPNPVSPAPLPKAETTGCDGGW